MKKIDLSMVPVETPSSYPHPFDEPCRAHAGLTQFGVNVDVIEAGTWSSQRHWHSHEDEFVWVLDGELTLVTTDRQDRCVYPDIDMISDARGYSHRDGTPYPSTK